jgi:endonuclease/exonuclease/phosphatase family metal-dependent hydrolase
MAKSSQSIRIINWNVQSFNGLTKSKTAKKLTRTDIENSISKYQPDIICLQEFNTSGSNSDESDNIALFSKNYPFHFFSEDYQRIKGKYKSGCIIFSKLPIIATGKIKFKVAESLIYADVIKGSDTIRVFTTHIQSFKFKKEDYEGIDNLGNTNDEAMLASMNIVKKMKLAFSRRSKQVELVKESINQSPYPNILCGDFNDVPYSYTYFTLKENRKDAFLEKQFGIGKTFIGLAYSLRIDYILPDKHFIVQQFDLIDENLSDHLMLVADIQLEHHK